MENQTHLLLCIFVWIFIFTIKNYALFVAGNLFNFSLDIVIPLCSRFKNLAFEKISK